MSVTAFDMMDHVNVVSAFSHLLIVNFFCRFVFERLAVPFFTTSIISQDSRRIPHVTCFMIPWLEFRVGIFAETLHTSRKSSC